MAQTIEETLKHCKNCQKQTKHARNSSSTGFLSGFLHVILTLMTVGFWLVLLIIWKLMFVKIGGWTCSQCGFVDSKPPKRSPMAFVYIGIIIMTIFGIVASVMNV